MEPIIKDKFTVSLLDKTDAAALAEVQKLRYKFLCKEYNDLLPDDGRDDDGLDLNSEILIVTDTEKGKIVGTYRVTTPLCNVERKPYLIERQYDISSLVQSDRLFGCVSRLCVDADYRDGAVITLLLKGLFRYLTDIRCEYVLGLCSFHGTDETLYRNAFTCLSREYREEEFDFKAVMNPVALDSAGDDYDESKVRAEMPGVLRTYLAMGHKVCATASIDKEFNCIDVLIVLNCQKINQQFMKYMLR